MSSSTRHHKCGMHRLIIISSKVKWLVNLIYLLNHSTSGKELILSLSFFVILSPYVINYMLLVNLSSTPTVFFRLLEGLDGSVTRLSKPLCSGHLSHLMLKLSRSCRVMNFVVGLQWPFQIIRWPLLHSIDTATNRMIFPTSTSKPTTHFRLARRGVASWHWGLPPTSLTS